MNYWVKLKINTAILSTKLGAKTYEVISIILFALSMNLLANSIQTQPRTFNLWLSLCVLILLCAAIICFWLRQMLEVYDRNAKEDFEDKRVQTQDEYILECADADKNVHFSLNLLLCLFLIGSFFALIKSLN